MTDPRAPVEESDTIEDVPVVPYPSTTVPMIAAVGTLMTLAVLITALTEMEPYTWALAPFIFMFAALPYFGLALRARRDMRPVSHLVLTVSALITVSFGGFVYFTDVIASQGPVSANTFITVPLWQTLPVALAVGIIWLLEPNPASPALSDTQAGTDAERNGADDDER
jgi:hypothetical protein